ncbi:MAG: ACP phosphodiesterase [Fulvivirga sp.]
MNFLAHAYLSGENPKLMVGNFMGDFVKGKQFEQFDKTIANGILLHRLIDEFTDNHKTVAQSKRRFSEKYRHYSGVIVDVAYDHYLAKNWSEYHTMDLLSFTQYVYNTLDQYKEIFPERFGFMLGYMKRDNWLYNYAELSGIDRALTGMSKRTKFNSKMEMAAFDISKHYEELEKEFNSFFPEVIAFVNSQLKTLGKIPL